mmetsp:Transcript_49214/g.145280  ORF Transcript_49214/g.145280 Transcript_49214/m.145280 type:complete len:219 (-) Transcript_49214:619-1275(-)
MVQGEARGQDRQVASLLYGVHAAVHGRARQGRRPQRDRGPQRLELLPDLAERLERSVLGHEPPLRRPRLQVLRLQPAPCPPHGGRAGQAAAHGPAAAKAGGPGRRQGAPAALRRAPAGGGLGRHKIADQAVLPLPVAGRAFPRRLRAGTRRRSGPGHAQGPDFVDGYRPPLGSEQKPRGECRAGGRASGSSSPRAEGRRDSSEHLGGAEDSGILVLGA